MRSQGILLSTGKVLKKEYIYKEKKESQHDFDNQGSKRLLPLISEETIFLNNEEIKNTYEYDSSKNLINIKTSYQNSQTFEERKYTYLFNRLIKEENNYSIIWNSFKGEVEFEGPNVISCDNLIFKYDENNQRIRKQNNDYVIKYYYNDELKLIAEEQNGKVIHYYYDYSGRIIGFDYNKDKYFYVYDAFESIIGIIDKDAKLIARYRYDAYGKHEVLNYDGTVNNLSFFIGNINPIRYKGYYFDRETNLYLTQRGFYNPETEKYLVPLAMEELNPLSIEGLELYRYACSNPVTISTFTEEIAKTYGASTVNSMIASGASRNTGGSTGGKGWKLPELPGFIDPIRDLVNGGYGLNQGIQVAYYAWKNASFFDDMIMFGNGPTKSINGLTGSFWNLGPADFIFLGLDIGFDIYGSMQNGLNWQGTAVGAGLTAVKGVAMIYTGKGIIYGATAIGSLICPGVGTVVGFIVGVGVAIIVDWQLGKWLDKQIGKAKNAIG